MPKRRMQQSLEQSAEDESNRKIIMIPERVLKKSDYVDAIPASTASEDYPNHADYGRTSTVRIATMPVSKTAERYNMNHQNRGTCLIFNHEFFETKASDRKGSNFDVVRIQNTFTQLGFSVIVYNNLTHSNLMSQINKLSNEDHSNNDCVCVFILTHGLDRDFLMAKDAAYTSDSIWKPFTADKCPTLAGKPKLFFIQACRGQHLDHGVTLIAQSGSLQVDSAVASYTVPTHSDFLIAHSSADGFFSWRNPLQGAWFIQCLCDVLDEFAESTDLLRMLTITARTVATNFQSYDNCNLRMNAQKQVPTITSTLIRDLYLTPK